VFQPREKTFSTYPVYLCSTIHAHASIPIFSEHDSIFASIQVPPAISCVTQALALSNSCTTCLSMHQSTLIPHLSTYIPSHDSANYSFRTVIIEIGYIASINQFDYGTD
jgi:hypothetical protein